MSHVADALHYAEQVVSGDILSCKAITQACQRFLDDLELADNDGLYYFDIEAAERPCNFIEKLPHTKGQWAKNKQKLKLEPWQKFIVCNIFGWKKKSDNFRRFTEVYAQIPRKNGKSALAAGIGNYMFVADGEFGAEIYSGATTEAQAWEVFRPAKQMVERTEPLKTRFDVQVNAKNMCVLSDGSRFEPVIGNPGDGASPSMAITDEYHEHKDNKQYETMQTGMVARDQPLMFAITTAGSNHGGPCYEQYQTAKKVLNKTLDNDRLFIVIYEVDEDDEWDSDESLVKANPNLSVSINRGNLEASRDSARKSASKQNAFRTKHLNEWVGSRTAWMNMLAWQKQKRTLKMEDFIGQPCHVGLDLASKKDVAAVVYLFQDEAGKFTTFQKFYAPEASADGNDKYRPFELIGELTLTDGNSTDYATIENDLAEASKIYDIRSAAFDEWQGEYLAQRLMSHGINMVKYPNQVRTFSEPMKNVEALILDGKLQHDGNSMMTWMVGNVSARVDAKDNIYPRKENPNDQLCKIDGLVALIMAMGRWLADDDQPRTVDSFIAII